MPVPSPTCLVFLIRDLGHGGAQRQLVTLAGALAGQGTFDITVECHARAPLSGPDKGDAEAAADALLQAVWQRLSTGAAPAGVHMLTDQPRITWDLQEGDTPLALATLTFGVQLSTHNTTLAAWS